MSLSNSRVCAADNLIALGFVYAAAFVCNRLKPINHSETEEYGVVARVDVGLHVFLNLNWLSRPEKLSAGKKPTYLVVSQGFAENFEKEVLRELFLYHEEIF